MKIARKIISAILSAIICFMMIPMESIINVSATQDRTDNFNQSYTLTGNGPTDMLNIAFAQVGRTGSDLGYSEHWCANFVSDCADLAGQSAAIPRTGAVSNEYTSTSPWYGIKQTVLNAGGSIVTSPQPGDLVIWKHSNCSYGGCSHVEIVSKVSDGVVYCLGGNTGNPTWTSVQSAVVSGERTVSQAKACSPDYYATSNGNNVHLWSYQGHDGQIMSIYANWESNPITVAYSANGGTGTMSNQSMKYDQTANLTANAFTRTGYTFAGWNTKADGSGTSYADKASVKNLATSGTVTMYAKWTANKYTVKFDGNGADELGKTSMEVTYNSTYGELPQPKRDGYNFIGWYTKAEGGNAITPDAKVTITGTQTLYAQWSQVKFLITFNATGGISESAQKLVTYDKAYGVLPTAERTGYTFKGWYLDVACTQQITSDTIVALTANQSVYAKWEIIKYVITFDATGGVAERDSKQVTYGKTYGVLPSATKDGDEFIGWFTEDGIEITSASIVEIESDTTLYAKWASDKVLGDVNADGVFNVADVVMMQKWLLCAGKLTDWQAGDLCKDERIDVFDLCLMKRLLIEKEGN